MSVPATGNITLSGINTVFSNAVGYSLATYNGTTVYDVGTGTSTAIAKPISMRTFANKTPLGRVDKPTITVSETANVASGTSLSGCITISWTTPTGATPTGYAVEWSTDGTTFTALSTPTNTSTTHSPTSNTRYWYRVRATKTGSVGAWSSNSGAAVFPYKTTVATFTPPTSSTLITITGAAGGQGDASSGVYSAYGIKFSNLQGNPAATYTLAFGGAGSGQGGGAGITSFTLGGTTFSGGNGGTGQNTRAGGGGGASIIAANGSSFFIVGGGGGASDTRREYYGGCAGSNLDSWNITAIGSDGGFTGTKGAAAGGGSSIGGAGGQGANANAQTGGTFFSNSTTVTLGFGGYGVTNGTYAGGGGGGGYSGGGGGAAADNDRDWGGQYFAGGGGGGSSYYQYTPFLSSPTPGAKTTIYRSPGWAYATW